MGRIGGAVPMRTTSGWRHGGPMDTQTTTPVAALHWRWLNDSG